MVQVSTTWHTFFINILKSQVSNIDCRLKIFMLKRDSKWWSNSKAFCIFLSKWNLKNVSQDFLQIQRSRSWECFKGWKRREVFHKTFLRDWFLLERYLKTISKETRFFANCKFPWHSVSLVSSHIYKLQKSRRIRGIYYVTLIFYQVILTCHVIIPMK